MGIVEQFRKVKKAQEGIKVSRKAKINFLTNLYRINDPWYDNTELKYPPNYFENESDESVDWFYNLYKDNEDYVYAPYGMEGVEVVGYPHLKLFTYYPMIHPYYDSKIDENFKWTGHSVIRGGAYGTKTFSDDDYNLAFNNCSDETRRMLEAAFGKSSGVIGFTTPGDVRDFAIENGGTALDKQQRVISIPMNKERYARLRKYTNSRNK